MLEEFTDYKTLLNFSENPVGPLTQSLVWCRAQYRSLKQQQLCSVCKKKKIKKIKIVWQNSHLLGGQVARRQLTSHSKCPKIHLWAAQWRRN